MAEDHRGEVTRILEQFHARPDDGREATDRLFQILYFELHALAENLVRGERHQQTIQPTVLINEAYLKLAGGTSAVAWETRAHFMRTASRAMRQVLVDYARKRAAAKRGGGVPHVTLNEELTGRKQPEMAVVALSEALEKLSGLDERTSRVVEMRVFAGMKMAEIAHVLSVSKATVDSDWRFAKAWLGNELKEAVR